MLLVKIKQLTPKGCRRAIRWYYRIIAGFYNKLAMSIYGIDQEQLTLLSQCAPKDTRKIILFLVPSNDDVSGGLMSIYRLYEQTVSLKETCSYEVFTSRYPCDYFEIKFNKYTKFDNNMYIFFFSSIYRYFTNIESIILHIPEYIVPEFIECHNRIWNKQEHSWWNKIKYKHINVLNQNILAMPKPELMKGLYRLADKVTQTTAHHKYANQEIRNRYGVPLHHFSAHIACDYKRSQFDGKDKIIMISPDQQGSIKTMIIEAIKRQFPDFAVIEIRNMRYSDYRAIADKAMFSITFGEGLDAYFLEPIWSGGVSFAVYNQDFFTKDFRELHTVYPDYQKMLDKICIDMTNLKNAEIYDEYNERLKNIVDKQYSFEEYRENIKQFYLGNYLYP